MNMSFSNVQELFGGLTNRGEQNNKVLNQTMPEQLVPAVDSPIKTSSPIRRRHYASASKKKPVFVPGVTEVDDEEDEDDRRVITGGIGQGLSLTRRGTTSVLQPSTTFRHSMAPFAQTDRNLNDMNDDVFT